MEAAALAALGFPAGWVESGAEVTKVREWLAQANG